jgi:hypothetical protein
LCEPELGVIVRKTKSTDKQLYVVPLCRKHASSRSTPIEVGESNVLVPANKQEFCGRETHGNALRVTRLRDVLGLTPFSEF